MEKSGQGGTEVPPIQRRRLRESIRRPRWIVAVVMTAIVVIVVLLALVPVSRTATFNFGSSESGSAITRFDSSGYWAVCPSGSRMTVAFASTGLNVTFSITAPTGTTIWEQHAAYANVSFSVPACGTYLINAEGAGNGTFSVVATLSYSAPLL